MANGLALKLRPRWLQWLFAGCLLASALSAGAQAPAQPWPTRPIRWIIPFPAGGPADINARMIAPRLAERLGQPVIVDNRPGAASNIGYEAAARAAPDGYTMVMGVAGLVTNPHVYKLNFDPIKDLQPVAQIVTIQVILVAHPSFRANNLTEALELARRNPGTVRCAWGASTVLQLACETLKHDGKADITVVGYKGSAPALNDLLGGHVDMMFDVPNSAAPHVASGKLKALATTNPSRGQQPYPSLPSANESIPGFEFTTWQGLFVPAGTPRAIVERLNRETNAILAEPEVARVAAESGLNIVPMTPAAFSGIVKHDYEMYGRMIRAAGIKAD